MSLKIKPALTKIVVMLLIFASLAGMFSGTGISLLSTTAYAAGETVSNEQRLRDAVADENIDTINLDRDIALNSPLVITRSLTINGNGWEISVAAGKEHNDFIVNDSGRDTAMIYVPKSISVTTEVEPGGGAEPGSEACSHSNIIEVTKGCFDCGMEGDDVYCTHENRIPVPNQNGEGGSTEPWYKCADCDEAVGKNNWGSNSCSHAGTMVIGGDGVRFCTFCGYWENVCTHNTIEKWRKCTSCGKYIPLTAEECNAKYGKGSHQYAENDTYCVLCGYGHGNAISESGDSGNSGDSGDTPTITTTEPVYDVELKINNLTVDGGEKVRCIWYNSDSTKVNGIKCKLYLTNSTIKNGYADANNVSGCGAGVCIGTPGDADPPSKGKTLNNISFWSYGTTFESNQTATGSSTNGGAVYLSPRTWGVFEGGTVFKSNKSHSGGAFFNAGYAYVNGRDFGCTFEDNYASQRGGAILAAGVTILNEVNINGQSSGQQGGAICVTASKTEGSDADWNFRGSIVLCDCDISGNQANTVGGGVSLLAGAELYVGGSTKITGNVVDDGGGETSDNNVYITNSQCRIYVYSRLTCEKDGIIGISTSNPVDFQTVVWSYLKKADFGSDPTYFDINWKSLTKEGVAPSNDGYDMNTQNEPNGGDFAKFVYDSELYYVEQEHEGTEAESYNGSNMWLRLKDTRYIVFDANVPGMTAEPVLEYETSAKGEDLTDKIPTIGNQTINGVTFTFLGWYTKPKDSDEGNEKVTSINTKDLNEAVTVYYGHWDISGTPTGGGPSGSGIGLYNVFWDYNYDGAAVTSGMYGTIKLSISTYHGYSEVTGSFTWSYPAEPSRTGYTFLGWSTDKNATSGNKNPNDPKAPTTFFAIWEANKYTITWDANGGTATTSQTLPYDTEITAPAEPTRTGYSFDGWYLDQECSIPLTSGLKVSDHNQTFYAGWKADKVLVTYHDTRDGNSEVATQEYNYEDALKLLAAMNDTSGWTFVRWATASGAAISDGTILDSSVCIQKTGSSPSGVTSNTTYWALDLYAVWAEKTTDYVVNVTWDDYTDNDGCRPQSITVGLVSSEHNSSILKTGIIYNDGNNTQSYTFKDLSITETDSSTDKITYSIVLLGYTDCKGYYYEIGDVSKLSGDMPLRSVSSYDTSTMTMYRYAVNNTATGAIAAQYTTSIKISHDLITTGDDIKFSLTWKDDSDRDGARPGSITLVLYANGQKVRTAPLHISGTGIAQVSSSECNVSKDGNTWTYIFRDYQKYMNGKAIEYTVAVTNLDESTRYNGNGYITEYMSELAGQGKVESDPKGAYLSRDIELTDKTITVNWDDESNRDGVRPSEVTVSLYAYQWNRATNRWENVFVDSAEINGDVTVDTWSHTFKDVPVYNGGVKIVYYAHITSDLNAQIKEGQNEYTVSETELNITASRIIDTKSVTAEIEWDDDGNNDKIRPTFVIIQLYADGEKVPGAKYSVLVSGNTSVNFWEYTFEDVPVHVEGEEGKDIIYTISVEEAAKNSLYGYYIITANGEEEEVLRYEASYLYEDLGTGKTVNTLNFNDSDRAYVKLSHICETKTMNFSVNWHDGDNRDAVRPDSVSVDLYKSVGNNEPVYLRTLVITEGKNKTWTYKVTNLPGYEDGQPVKYTIEVPDDVSKELESRGYTTTTEDNIVSLYYTPKTGSISTQLYWSDDNNNDGYRPDSVVAVLYANGVSTGYSIDLNETNNWSGTWTDLNVHYVSGTKCGVDVVYSVVIEAPFGYEAAYNPESTTIEENETLYIQLSHVADTADVPVTVYWNDVSNKDGKRPETLTVMLLVNGEPSNHNLTLNADNAGASSNIWNGVFEDMPVYSGDGKEVYYSLSVYDTTTTTGGYSVMTAGTTLYLSYKPVASSMYVSFQFNDSNNADGERPTGLYLQLTANGVPVDDSEYKHTVSFDTNVDGYVWNFGELPVYAADSTKIAYNVVVTFAPELGAMDYGVWTSNDIKLSESGNAAVNQIIVKLSRGANTIEATGYVYWFDANDVEGNRPSTLDLVLKNTYSDSFVTYTLNSITGEVTNRATRKVVGTVTVTEWTDDSSVWTYTISGLSENYVNNVGESSPIYYYVTANTSSIDAYYPTVRSGEEYGLDVALTHCHYTDYCAEASQNYTVNIMWQDNSNTWGYRPDSNGVRVNLLANGEVYDTVYLTKAHVVEGNDNAWSYTFENIPTYRAGSAIVWSVEAADVTGYNKERVAFTATAGTINYTQFIGFDFMVNWNDSDNDDAVRPDSVSLTVFGDGIEAGSVTLTGDGDTWTGEITSLPVWRETDADAAIEYTFLWNDDTAQYLVSKGYTAAPTLNGTEVESKNFYYLSASEFGDNEDEGYNSLTGKYYWETTLTRNKEVADYYFSVMFDDDLDRDGIRPETLKVNLLAGGQVIDSQELAINIEENTYSLVWEQLEIYESGEAITYTIALENVPKDYVAEYNATHTNVTLRHNPELVSVTGTVNWDDSTQLVNVYNANGTYVRNYEQIARVGVYVQLYADGEAYGEPVFIDSSIYGEGEVLIRSASVDWDGLYKYRDNGTEIVYDMTVYSDDLSALLKDGHSLTYDFGTKYEPAATITHDLYDIRGTVYYMYTYSDDFLLDGVPVTAYLQESNGSYRAVGSAITGENGQFELLNLPQGLYIIRATYVYGENTLAGAKGIELNRQDGTLTVIVDRDAVNDADYYQYTATGTAYYQTDITNADTIKPVPEGSIVLLYKLVDGLEEPVYVGMTSTDANGRYAFGGLNSANYIVNVVFNHNGGVYTYDNSDALSDGLKFLISGADTSWPDIIKQVNADTNAKDPTIPDEPIVEPDPEPIPCVTGGYVFFSDNGVHSTDPIEGVDVYVYLKSSNVEIGHTTTDENGHWEIEGLAPTDYIAVFSYQGNASRVLLFTITESDYNNGTYEAAPQYFDRNVEAPTGTIKGVVLDENGNPMRALVAIYNAENVLQDFAYTDTFGGYEFTVIAGYDYNVRILAVEDEVTTLKAGDPDDDLTTLDYYVLSGVFGVDGVLQAGQLIAVYYDNGESYDLVTATLTDDNGRFAVKVYEEGNYRVCPYVNSEIYEIRDVSVGYQEERPHVSTAVNGTYTISGIETYQALELYKMTNSVETTVYTESGVNATSYEIPNLDAGEYRLCLTNNGKQTWYYLTCPEGALVDVTYYVTISGSVVDNAGNAIIGANVVVYDSNGNQVGTPTTILSDGKYEYRNLIEGEYTVVITSPNTSSVMADKWTYEPDSYGVAYEQGMASSGVWTWNINAHMVAGTVMDQHGNAIEGAYVNFNSVADETTVHVAITDENGRYTIGLAPGAYNVSTSYFWDENHKYPGTGLAYLNLSEDVDDADFVIYRHNLTVEAVRSADGTIAAGAEISIYYQDGTLYWTGTADENGQISTLVFPDDYLITGSYDGAKAVTEAEAVVDDTTITLKFDSVVYITGTVRDENGNVVSDGLVYYSSSNNSGYVYTDDNGGYKIPVSSSELGEYTLYAAHGSVEGNPVTVDVQTDVKIDLTVNANELTESHTITGIVTDEEGNRLANALVTMTWGNDKTNNAVTSTNSRGEYSFEVSDGTYYLTALYEADNGNRYATNAEYAVHVNGEDAEQNLMVLVGYTVNVTVIDADGNAVPYAAVTYTGAASGTAQVGSDGTMSLYLPLGNYRFFAKTASRTSKTISVTVSGNTDVTLELVNTGIEYEEPIVIENALKIWGYVYNPNGEPVENADVKLYKQDLETLEWNLVSSNTTDGNGYYEFPELESGTYRVDTVYTHTVEVDADASGYVVTGTLTDEFGNPMENCRVELWTEAGDLVAEVITGEDGVYTFDGANPDETYIVKAWDAAEEPILDSIVPVTATQTVISGIVQDVAGHIVVGAEVVITDSNGEIVATTVSDETGRYDVAVDGNADSYSITITYPASYEIDTSAYVRDTTDLNAPYLTPSWYTIEGYVHDTDGNPVSGAIVVLYDSEHNEINRYTTVNDGYYIFDYLEAGVYYIEVIYKDSAEREYRVVIGDGTGSVEPVEPAGPENINVHVTNFSIGYVTEPASGWVKGENSFTVSCEYACAVFAVSTNGMVRLHSEATDTEDTYKFVADLSEGDEILVITKGDVNLDGYITIADLVCMNQYIAGEYTLSEYAKIAADINCSGDVTIADFVFLNRYIGGEYVMVW